MYRYKCVYMYRYTDLYIHIYIYIYIYYIYISCEDFNTGVSCDIAKFLITACFYRTPPVLMLFVAEIWTLVERPFL